MIRFAVIHRAKDGLALSASTDVESGVELRESKRYAKIISKKARQFPIRSIMQVGRFNVCFLTESEVCFLMICEASYAQVLGYSFLEDLKKDFLNQYTRGAVEKAVRPYSFIEFDANIQKVKQRYNSTRTMNTRVNLSEINDELSKNPPYQVTEHDLGVSQLNGPTSSFTATPVGHTSKLIPLSWIAKLSCALSLVCAVLNVIRLVPFVSQHDVEADSSWMSISLIFFFSAVINLLQSFLLLYPVSRRQVLSWACAFVTVAFLYMLNDYRNNVQVAFHMASNFFITFTTWKRTVLGKLPNYNV